MNTQDDLFSSLFNHRDSKIDQLGNPLIELDANVNWESFRSILSKVHEKKRKSNAGRKPLDVVMMFKCLVLGTFYNLSDEQLEYQIEDRRSFQRFLQLPSHKHAPDRNSIWLFKERLKELKLTTLLFEQFQQQLADAGIQARKGQLVDASFVKAPIQRNTRKENEQIKSGKTPETWSENKKRQKDVDARWTKKGGKSFYGYKNHVNVDNENKLIQKYSTTAASVHDSQELDSLLDDNNTSKSLWADSAYRSKEQEAKLKEKHYRSHIQRKGTRTKKLTEREKEGNKTRSKVRSRVEHPFALMSLWGGKSVRSIGKARAEVKIGFMNLVYNMRRFCFLQRMSAS